MKQLYLFSLLAVSLCLTLPAMSQTTDKAKEDTKVVIIKKQVDKDGEVTVETIVTTDGKIDEEVELNDQVMQIDVIKLNDSEDKEVLFVGKEGLHEKHIEVKVEADDSGKTIWIQENGQEELIELKAGEELSDAKREELEARGIHMYDGHAVLADGDKPAVYIQHGEGHKDGIGNRVHELTERIARMDFSGHRARARAHVAREHSNCVALGVFVHSQDGGAKVSGIIDGSGAQEAGLQSGDVIVAINEDAVESVRTLHKALGEYEPGEVVKVKYERDGDYGFVQSELRAWGDLPDYENSWRAEIKCGDSGYRGDINFLEPTVTKKVIIIKKGQDDAPAEEVEEVASIEENTTFDYALELDNFTVFPNPSDGKFRVQFESVDKPLTLSVFDATGREVYRDNMSDFNGFYNKEIDLSDAPRGSLFLSIAQEGKRYTDQIILQ